MARKKSQLLNEEQKKAIGRRIRESRGFDLNQEEFAKVFGITQTAVSKLEKGRVLPTVEILIRLSDYSGRSIDWILRGK